MPGELSRDVPSEGARYGIVREVTRAGAGNRHNTVPGTPIEALLPLVLARKRFRLRLRLRKRFRLRFRLRLLVRYAHRDPPSPGCGQSRSRLAISA